MKSRSPIDSFKFAAEGITHVVKTQKNMQRCILVSIAILLIGYAIQLTGVELILLCIPITFLLLAEMFNTAAEITMDLAHGKTFHPLVKLIKDITAGAVLIALIGLSISASILFIDHMPAPLGRIILACGPYLKYAMPPAVIAICLVTFAISLKKNENGVKEVPKNEFKIEV